jgi:fructokinase
MELVVSFFTGLDIGGTKIAGAVFSEDGKEIGQIVAPTPKNYSAIVTTCKDIVEQLNAKCGQRALIGVGVPGAMDRASGKITHAANLHGLIGRPLQADLEKALGAKVRIANDANCSALAEAVDGAGKGHATVFGLIMGTGVGGGFIASGKIIEGVNGMTGEIGHLPLPAYEASDGVLVQCGCGQKGCIESLTNGAALARLYEAMTGKKADAVQIAAAAGRADGDAVRVLDRFYIVVAKAMITIVHSFDPDIVVVSGGLNGLPGMYDEVPKRWGHYTPCKELKTKFVPAKFGAMAGIRGAAWLWR